MLKNLIMYDNIHFTEVWSNVFNYRLPLLFVCLNYGVFLLHIRIYYFILKSVSKGFTTFSCNKINVKSGYSVNHERFWL